MKEEDLLLSLSLCGNNDRYSDEKKKRKRNDHDAVDDAAAAAARDEKLFSLLQTRDRMLRVDPKRHGLEDDKGLQLIHLLLLSATAVDAKNVDSAVDALGELYRNASLNGDPIQRVTAYFADGLSAKLLTKKSRFYGPIMSNPTPEEQFSAFTELYRASPYYQFAHFTANQVIVEAFEEEEITKNSTSLHVIDLDVLYGFQWPSLIQSLSDKAATSGKRIALRITGFGRSLEELKETEMRLTCFARGCRNLDFEFNGVLRSSKPSRFKSKKNTTAVVNLVHHLHNSRSYSEICDMLNFTRCLSPCTVVLVEKEGGNKASNSFLSRFMESLHYFAAMFDSLDDCLPAESAERLSIERNQLGKEIKNAVSCDSREEQNQFNGHERLDTWKGRMESIGFAGVKLSSRSLSQAKLLLRIKSHCSAAGHGGGAGAGGFRIIEREGGMSISLGWQDRHLITASAWRPLS